MAANNNQKNAMDSANAALAGVIEKEIEQIRITRHLSGQPADRPVPPQPPTNGTVWQQADSMKLTGLALSGGGIRSATFCLGVIQSLCEGRLLRQFDYLSTVSGGGYIGGWLSAQIYHRCPSGTPLEIEDRLSPNETRDGPPKGPEDRSIGFLREYSNYLTPKLGLLSTDTLAAIAAYLRNLVLIQSILILMLVLVLFLPRLLFLGAQQASTCWSGWSFLIATVVLLFVSAFSIMCNLKVEKDSWFAKTRFVLPGIILPAVIAALVLAIGLAQADGPLGITSIVRWIAVSGILFGGVAAMMPAHISKEPYGPPVGAPLPGNAASAGTEPGGTRVIKRAAIIGAGMIAGGIGGALLWQVQAATQAMSHDAALWFAVSIAPFLILGALSLIIVLHLGLVGRIFEYEVQEWWARYGGWLIALTVFVGGTFAAGVYGAALVEYGKGRLVHAGGVAWLATSLWGVVKGASSKTSGERASWTERALVVVPYIFIVGLVITLSYGIYHFLPYDQETSRACPAKTGTAAVLCEMASQTGHTLSIAAPWAYETCALFLGLLLACGLLAWRVDVNLFSLNNFYRNRLTRCYLGAPRVALGERKPHPFTGFDMADDIPLDQLAARVKPAGPNGTFAQRPYHLLNTTLNITSGENLAWQQRKAASFFFSPLFCGFLLPLAYTENGQAGQFVGTRDYMRTRGIGTARDVGPMLGGTVAISGAAASPNSGFHTDPGVAFLLTLFNVRLGRWCPNPVRRPVPSTPALGGGLYINELFGNASSQSKYVYLSDGGHFDNLGLYELVRRRVRIAVVCDCGEDPPLQFDDLADTIRKCSSDFGVDIIVDVDKLRHVAGDKQPPHSHAHVVEGIIRYPKTTGVDGNSEAFEGTLILVKPTLTKEIANASDLINYALSKPAFPQQTTLDQWFDEAQFESYRKLGYLIGCQLQQTTFESGGTLSSLLQSSTGIQ
ncbi:hypothetical protein ABH944_003962 [Caballeronia udeis]|uniref:Patatin-like phospholipase n=2 Tax=Caballeronia udeis TaxID=1232866 RepID=A0ABW8MIU2_9BURK